MLVEIYDVINYLSLKINELKKDYEKVKRFKDELNKGNKVFYHNPSLVYDACKILNENRFNDFLSMPFNEKELKKIIGVSGSLISKLFFDNVSIRNGKIKNVESYACFMQKLFAPIQKISFKKIDKDANTNYSNLLDKITDNLCNSVNNYMNKHNNIINTYNVLIELLCDINKEEYLTLEYKNKCSKFIKYVNDNKIDIGKVDNLKAKLKNLIEDKKTPVHKKEDNNHFEKNASLKKDGTRLERKEKYEKEKLKDQIACETKNLDDDSKAWVFLIIEQLKGFNDEELDLFISNPYLYLPDKSEENYSEIISLTSLKIRYEDKNLYDKLEDSFKKLLGR